MFEDSTFDFVGQPGAIRGYRYGLRAISNKSMTDAVPAQGSLTFTPTSDACNYVNGWLTVIEDPNGKPFAISVMSDDDNAWTIMKGFHAHSSQNSFQKRSLPERILGFTLAGKYSIFPRQRELFLTDKRAEPCRDFFA